jgi:hypothetical protein
LHKVNPVKAYQNRLCKIIRLPAKYFLWISIVSPHPIY